jgi:secreted PhoX family phosphatase
MTFTPNKLSKAVLLAMLTAGLVACGGEDGKDGADGVNGTNGVDGTAGVDGAPGNDGENATAGADETLDPTVLKRVATAPLGAEFTGMYLNEDGTFFLNVQHPDDENTTADSADKTFDKGTVGVVVGADFNALGNIAALDLPITQADKEVVKTSVGSYQVLLQQGDVMGDGAAAGDIITSDGSSTVLNTNDPDFNGVISDGSGGYFLYTNWEDRPGGMSRIQVSGLGAEGYSSVEAEGMLDFSAIKGTWVNCFGTVTPWNTPISAEELYFDNSAAWYSMSGAPVQVAKYHGYPTDGSGDWSNPYDYGYNVEVGVNGTATAADEANVEVEKRFALGRFSHENAVVLPDNRTVLQSDDGSNVVFFKFVADTAGDLSSGTLYAAKMTQAADTSTIAEASFAIDWIELASATDSEIQGWIAEYDGTYAEAKYITDQQINDWAEAKTGTDIDGSGSVATSPFADDRVAFLETRKAAEALGATAEFNKMEGVNINYGLASDWWNTGTADGSQAYAYMAMSTIGSGMTDTSGDIQIEDDNARCGAVYRMKLVEEDGLVNVDSMVPSIVGGPYFGDRSVNECDVNNISNPDNLVILDDGRVLIGEDTGNHQNNMVWLFNDPAI